MKIVFAVLLLCSLLLLIQPYSVSAGTVVWTPTVEVKCNPFRAIPSVANYIVGNTMTWSLDTLGAGPFPADSVVIEFLADNPWYASQVVTATIKHGNPWTSDPTTRDNGAGSDFTYYLIRYSGGVAVERDTVSMGWYRPQPSLSTWAVLVLVLGLIAVSIALLRKRIRIGA